MHEFLVSVIIITFNEEKNIVECINSILKSNFNMTVVEIIVSDGGSADSTLDIIKREFGNKIVILNSPLKGMPCQRNFGFNNANGKYILSLDADMRISENLISEGVRIMENDKNIIALYVPEIIMGDSFFHKIRRFERSFYNSTVIDAARFFNREKAKEIGYFDEKLREAAEDWDFDKRLKQRGGFSITQSPLFHDESRITLKKYINKKVKYSGTMDDYIKKWGSDDPDLKKQFGLIYRYFTVFIENRKWKKLILHPVLTAGMYFIRFIIGFNFIFRKKNVN